MNPIYALVDCNNFYASCEKVFDPKLAGKPLVVLSNNDGCVIARSSEAKELGIKMAIPIFEVRDIVKKLNIQIRSSNYTLYGDMSQRVMETLKQFSDEIEVYSIDEAFIRIDNYCYDSLNDYATKIKDTVKRWTGLPVSVGIAPTKTLCKAANHLAKRNNQYSNVLDLTNNILIDELLSKVDVSDVWGVGRQYTKFLKSYGINNAKDLKYADEKWIQKHMTKIGGQTVLELRGIACKELEEVIPDKKGICCARSFGHKLEREYEIEEALASYVSRVAEKLRKQHSLAKEMAVFIQTNSFSENDKQYTNSSSMKLNYPTSYTPQLIESSHYLLHKIFKEGYKYKKVGVIVTSIIHESKVQYNLFCEPDSTNQIKISNVMDNLNIYWGRHTVRYAACGVQETWKMNQNLLSPRYTTNWNELPIVKSGF